MRKNGEKEFNILMECHDVAEICHFVSTFIVSTISCIMQEQNLILKERKKKSLKYQNFLHHLSL